MSNKGEEIDRLKRRLHNVDELVEWGLNSHYSPKKICGKYKDAGELVDVVIEWVAERIFYDYFGDMSEKKWTNVYYKLNEYVIEKYGDRIKENFNEECW